MYVHRTVILSGPNGYGRRVPPQRLAWLFGHLMPTIRKCVRMRFCGRSAARGRQDSWLDAASDVRFVDYSGDAETILHFETIAFAQAVPDLYAPSESWPARPAPEATGFEVLAQVVGDIESLNRESDAFDRPLLRQIARFAAIFDAHIQSLVFPDLLPSVARASALTPVIVRAADKLRAEVPPPRLVRLVGTLERLWERQQMFTLRLEGEPHEVRGSFLEADVAKLKTLAGQRVLVEGKAVYRPSRHVLRVDADRVLPAGDTRGSWDSVPPPLDVPGDRSVWQIPQTPQTGVNAIIGQWPGDETDAEVFDALERLS